MWEEFDALWSETEAGEAPLWPARRAGGGGLNTVINSVEKLTRRQNAGTVRDTDEFGASVFACLLVHQFHILFVSLKVIDLKMLELYRFL